MLGIALFFTAIGLGVWANDIAFYEAGLAWERSHLPPRKVLKYVCETFGLMEIRDLFQMQKLSRNLPASLDEAGSIWVASLTGKLEDGLACVVYYVPDEQSQRGTEPSVYCTPGSTLKRLKWEPMGLGWSALESALKLLEAKKSESPAASVQKHPKIPVDPREIRY